MIDNSPDSINEINFTKRCILMSVISQEKNLILINSFHKIPIVKLFTADSSFEYFIYSKIRGAFCYFMSKDSKNRQYFLRIYDLKDYSLTFNMEIKKEYIQYITQYQQNFYFMELRQSFLGFEFLSAESGRLFFLLLSEDPKKEIIEQNEKAMNIKSKEVSKTANKVTDYIKMRLKYKFENSNTVATTSSNYKRRENPTQKKDNFPIININDKNGEYLETSIIPQIELLINNLEVDDTDLGVLLFTEKNLDYEKCQRIIKKYKNILENSERRRNISNFPITIIDKDCKNILNKKLYTEIMIKNMLNNIRENEKLDIFRKEHKKRHKGIPTGMPRRRTTKGRLSKTGKRMSRLSNYSKIGSDRSTANESNNDDKNRRFTYNTNPSLKFKKTISINSDNTNNEKENKAQFEKDKKKINSLQTTEIFKVMGDDEEVELDKGKFNYFTNDDKNKFNNIKKEVDIIEEKPEDEEIDKEHKYKKREIKLPNKYKNNIPTTTNNNSNTNKAANTNSIASRANVYKRPITGKAGKTSMSNFQKETGKKK